MSHLLNDVRIAARMLLRAPAFTAFAVLTLMLGIGANTALFSVVRAVLLEPLPYGDADGAVVLWSSWIDFPRTWVSIDEIELYREQVRSLDAVGMFQMDHANLTGEAEPERLRVGLVTGEVFEILDVESLLGRGFAPDELVPGGPRVVVLGHALWRRRFASDPGVVGRTIPIDGRATLVVGVMPPGFRLPLDFTDPEGATEAWLPLRYTHEDYGAIPGPAVSYQGGSHSFHGLARLAPGATVEAANRELRALTDRLTAAGRYPEAWDFRATAVSVRDQITGGIRPALFVLLGAVGFVLLIACANVASLLLVRGDRRRRELAIRSALGAGRRRLIAQFLTEAVLLALVGGALGVWLAIGGVELVRGLAPASLPRLADVAVDGGVLVFALATSLVAALAFGAVPALHNARTDPSAALREGGRGATASAARLRWRQGLVVAEIALAVVLTIGAGLMLRTVDRLLAVDPGFRADGVLTVDLTTPAATYPEPDDVIGFYADLLARVRALPGVRAAGAARMLPLATQLGDMGLHVEGYTPPPGLNAAADWQVVTPGYLEAIGTPLIAGRTFTTADDAAAPPVLVINQELAERYFAGRDPIGGRIVVGGGGPPFTVVGVVADLRHNALTEPAKPQFYGPHAQLGGFLQRDMTLVVHTAGDPAALVRPIREQVRLLDSRLPISGVRTMDDVVAASIAQPRFTLALLGVFGALALALAVIGIYGVVTQVVAARRKEIGIRIALGAHTRDVVWLSLRSGLAQTALGLAIGAAAALALTRVMSGLIYGVSTTDVFTFIAALAVAAIVSLAASLLPARRAAGVDPVVELRGE